MVRHAPVPYTYAPRYYGEAYGIRPVPEESGPGIRYGIVPPITLMVAIGAFPMLVPRPHLLGMGLLLLVTALVGALTAHALDEKVHPKQAAALMGATVLLAWMLVAWTLAGAVHDRSALAALWFVFTIIVVLVWFDRQTEIFAARHLNRVEVHRNDVVAAAKIISAQAAALMATSTGDQVIDALAQLDKRMIAARVIDREDWDDGEFGRLVALPPGCSPALIAADPKAPAIVAASLGLPTDINLKLRPGQHSHDHLVLEAKRILELSPPEHHPVLDLAAVAAWDPLPLGIEMDSTPAAAELITRHSGVLVAGRQGAGKSTLLQGWTAFYILGTAETYLIDAAGGVELERWAHAAHGFAATPTQALDVLQAAITSMERRLTALAKTGQRAITPDMMQPLVVIADEVEHLYGTPQAKDIDLALRDLMGRGRKVGVLIIATLLDPNADVIPSETRGKMTIRACMRQIEARHVDIVLGGSGELAKRAPAHELTDTEPGAYYLKGSGEMRRLQAYPMDDEHLDALVSRAAPVTRPIALEKAREKPAASDEKTPENEKGFLTVLRGGPLTMKEIIERTGMSQATCYRVRKTLLGRGLLLEHHGKIALREQGD